MFSRDAHLGNDAFDLAVFGHEAQAVLDCVGGGSA
jgi:hypothetical protein